MPMRKLLFILLCISLSAAQGTIHTRSPKWYFETGASILTSPELQDGAVLIGSSNGNFYSINATDGALIWSFKSGGRIDSSPLVFNKMVFFGSDDGNLYALWLNGSLAWKFKTNDMIHSSPTTSDKMVFFGSDDGNLYALWLNGSLAWKFKTNDKIISSPALAYDFVYFGSGDGNFYALDASSGNLRWNYSGYLAFSSSPLASNWIVYAGSDEDMLYAFQAFNGTVLWKREFPGKIQSSFALSQNVLYFPCKDGNIYAVYAGDGSTLWNISTGTEAQSSVYYSNDSGMLYYGTTDHSVYGANSDGRTVWEYTTANWVISTPKARNGMLYVGSYDGRLYAISTMDAEFPSSSISVSGSPVAVNGSAYADSGVKYVQVRVNEGEWENASGTGNWSYLWNTSGLQYEGYMFEARAVDAHDTIEPPPYASATVNLLSSQPGLKELNVSFPQNVVIGLPISFQVKDSDGNPVPNPTLLLLGKTYTGDEKGVIDKDDKGNLITLSSEGTFNFTVSKDGYASRTGEITVVKMFDILPYIAGAVAVLLVLFILTFIASKRLMAMRKKQ